MQLCNLVERQIGEHKTVTGENIKVCFSHWIKRSFTMAGDGRYSGKHGNHCIYAIAFYVYSIKEISND